jgi:hypothetical protein
MLRLIYFRLTYLLFYYMGNYYRRKAEMPLSMVGPACIALHLLLVPLTIGRLAVLVAMADNLMMAVIGRLRLVSV